MRFLLDTCVISELVSRQPDLGVVKWIDSIDEVKLFLSSITIGEIKKGIEKLATTNRQRALSEWLEDELLVRFKDKVLPIDTAVMLVWGKLVADLEKQGKPMPAIDSLLAATALQGGLTLVTRNEDDFAHCGAIVVNPWER
ncbi:MAG: type II toxin-antitoxin system VapC family toxin [Proteobacteria bacterium]|nr:type II toxin-antitoxin system VapC family toxin [Pseudomonadota bacterium]